MRSKRVVRTRRDQPLLRSQSAIAENGHPGGDAGATPVGVSSMTAHAEASTPIARGVEEHIGGGLLLATSVTLYILP